MTQLSLSDFPNHQFDERPLPLITADKWGFALYHVDRTGDAADYLYCARDWYIGLGGKKNAWSMYKNDWFTHSEPVMIEVKRPRRKPEMLEFVNAEGLYAIAARMESKADRPQVADIKAFLAKAGVLIDDARRDPRKAAALAEAMTNYHQNRADGIVTRNELTAWLRGHFGASFPFGQITNEEYKGLFGRVASQLKAETGNKNARDGMTAIGLKFLDLAEMTCVAMFDGRESVSQREAFDIVRDVCNALGVSVRSVQDRLRVDLATGMPLLENGDFRN